MDEELSHARLLSQAGKPSSLSPCLSRAAREQVRLDEVVDVAVEHGVHVAALDLGACVLDHAVGREHVVAYLRAERDVGLARFERSHLGPALLKLKLVELRA